MEMKGKSRAESLLPEVLPDLIAILNEAPCFGDCGLAVTYHEGAITRIVTRIEKSRKTCGGCEK
jgi:hypothetical protein